MALLSVRSSDTFGSVVDATKTLSVAGKSPERLQDRASASEPGHHLSPAPTGLSADRFQLTPLTVADSPEQSVQGALTKSSPAKKLSLADQFSRLFSSAGDIPENLLKRFVNVAAAEISKGIMLSNSSAWLTASALVQYQQIHQLTPESFCKLAKLTGYSADEKMVKLSLNPDNSIQNVITQINSLIDVSNMKQLKGGNFHKLIGVDLPDVRGAVSSAGMIFKEKYREFKQTPEILKSVFDYALKPFKNWAKDVLRDESGERSALAEWAEYFPPTVAGIPVPLATVLMRSSGAGFGQALRENPSCFEGMYHQDRTGKAPELFPGSVEVVDALVTFERERILVSVSRETPVNSAA